jgi:hypothetical protein
MKLGAPSVSVESEIVPYKEEPPARRPAASRPSGDDAPVLARLGGIRGQCFVGVEVFVALDGKAKRTTEVANLVHAHESEFRQQPGALCVGRKELHDGSEVDVGLLVVHADDLRLAVGDECFVLGFGEE